MGDLRSKLQAAIESIFPAVLGIELIETSTERIVGRLLVRSELCNLAHALHGGAFMTFADTLGGLGAFVNLPPGARTTTVESKTNFLRAASEGSVLVGESRPLHRGRTTMVWETRMSSEGGALCAVVTQTQLVIASGNNSRIGAGLRQVGAE